MKVEIKEKERVKGKERVKESEFPRLMKCNAIDYDNGIIVLFHGYGIGTVVLEKKYSSSLGYHSRNWVMSDFTDFEGSITLSND